MDFDIYDEEIQEMKPKKKRSGCLAVIIAAVIILLAAAGLFFSGILFSTEGNGDKVTEQLIEGFRNHEEVITLSPISQDELNYVLEKVHRMPEFFYLAGEYSCITRPITKKVELTVNYSYDGIDEKQAEIDSAVDSMLSTIPADASDYEKVIAVHDWLCDHIVYEPSEDSSDQNIYGALAKGSCICAGYAKSFAYLLDILGIENEYLTGDARDSNGETGPHAWNSAVIDGNRYYFDVTWDDADERGIEYFYFAITQDEMGISHFTDEKTLQILSEDRAANGSSSASDSATDDNYYYKNDYVLWTASPSELSNLIKSQGKGVARIRCNDAAVYDYLTKIVRDTHGMYNVLTSAGIYVSNIYCVSNKDLRCMTIYY